MDSIVRDLGVGIVVGLSPLVRNHTTSVKIRLTRLFKQQQYNKSKPDREVVSF